MDNKTKNLKGETQKRPLFAGLLGYLLDFWGMGRLLYSISQAVISCLGLLIALAFLLSIIQRADLFHRIIPDTWQLFLITFLGSYAYHYYLYSKTKEART